VQVAATDARDGFCGDLAGKNPAGKNRAGKIVLGKGGNLLTGLVRQ
jgi:hypothetical protein